MVVTSCSNNVLMKYIPFCDSVLTIYIQMGQHVHYPAIPASPLPKLLFLPPPTHTIKEKKEIGD